MQFSSHNLTFWSIYAITEASIGISHPAFMQVSQKNCPAIMIPHFLILGHIKGFLHEFAWTSYYFMFHLSGERVLTFMLTVVNKSVSN